MVGIQPDGTAGRTQVRGYATGHGEFAGPDSAFCVQRGIVEAATFDRATTVDDLNLLQFSVAVKAHSLGLVHQKFLANVSQSLLQSSDAT